MSAFQGDEQKKHHNTSFPTMSKKRYVAFHEAVKALTQNEDLASSILSELCSVLHYDPDTKCYDEGYRKRMKAWRDRVKQAKIEQSRMICDSSFWPHLSPI